MDDKRNSCEVCFHDFDHQERRSRVIPCGHTFCSKCVSDNFKQNILLCPICRKEHHAETAADFPVNFRLESVLLDGQSIPSTSGEISSPTTNEPKAISKKLKSMRSELCNGMESKATDNKEVRLQLQQYEKLLSEKETMHQQIKEKHLAIAQQNEDAIQIIRKESARIAEALKDEEEETQRMKIVSDKLYAATTSQEVFLSMDDATICYDFLEKWNQEAQESFPNSQLLTKSVELIEQSQILLQTFPDKRSESTAEEPREVTSADHLSDNVASFSLHGLEASSVSSAENEAPEELSRLKPKLSIQEKVIRAMEKASFPKPTKTPAKVVDEKSVQTEPNAEVKEFFNKEIQTEEQPPSIESLRMRSESVVELMKKKRLFAVQDFEGRRRFAQISLEEKNRILLHCLKDQKIPSNAHLLQHSDVINLVNVSSRLCFFELHSKEENKTLGKLFIRLSPDGKRAQQFALLCSGQNGPSYVDTNIINVENKGDIYYERVQCGDYENLGGGGGRALVSHVLEEEGGVFIRPRLAGTIQGLWSSAHEAIAAQFLIYTRDYPGLQIDCCFGMVEEGLPILQHAINYHLDISNVIISDAGLVLDI